ncbi:MAG: hypothetical protein HQL53_04205 [Magnetococcales bacterium]|nr:hypothetical protein [Magnetococcales bacterium]
MSAVTPKLKAGQLYRVEDAVPFKRQAYAVYRVGSENLTLVQEALGYLDV